MHSFARGCAGLRENSAEANRGLPKVLAGPQRYGERLGPLEETPGCDNAHQVKGQGGVCPALRGSCEVGEPQQEGPAVGLVNQPEEESTRVPCKGPTWWAHSVYTGG